MADGLMSLPHLSSQKEQPHCRLGPRKHFHLSYGGGLKLNKKIQYRSFKVNGKNNYYQHVIYKASILKLEMSRDTNFPPTLEMSFSKVLQLVKR
jgi:hypothetical protein